MLAPSHPAEHSQHRGLVFAVALVERTSVGIGLALFKPHADIVGERGV
jgi:hypothetical protein